MTASAPSGLRLNLNNATEKNVCYLYLILGILSLESTNYLF